ncbi:MAG: ABC transporter ATP-binding protein [Clostridiales bacterium]|jgi:ABC-2 type transport system ATP-binding protein|nr:ABC transporter ATP-binding protein [Clostridiales bacterium]
MLQIENLSKQYANSGVYAVENLNLTVNPGEIFGFLGPNGAGKTTTIKMVTGILPYRYGRIAVAGADVRQNPIEAKKNIGYVPDSGVVYDKLSGAEYLNFMADVYGVPVAARRDKIGALLETFNLQDAVGNQIRGYSHGMKQKIVVIGALLHDPKLWVLDEPLTGLDPQSSFDLKRMMRKHCEVGNTVFFSTHVLEVAEKLCDRIGIVNKGRLVFIGSMKDIKEWKRDESLEQVFLEVTGGKAQEN